MYQKKNEKMDTSKEYIAMCVAAEEIQDYFGNCDNQIGKTLYYYQMPGEGINWKVEEAIGVAYCCDYPSERTKTIWLPSQDQLQDVCPGEGILRVLHNFSTFVFYQSNDKEILLRRYPGTQFATAEQLWLAYLMYITLQKRWNGEKWEKM
jgi:hypothetical protein